MGSSWCSAPLGISNFIYRVWSGHFTLVVSFLLSQRVTLEGFSNFQIPPQSHPGTLSLLWGPRGLAAGGTGWTPKFTRLSLLFLTQSHHEIIPVLVGALSKQPFPWRLYWGANTNPIWFWGTKQPLWHIFSSFIVLKNASLVALSGNWGDPAGMSLLSVVCYRKLCSHQLINANLFRNRVWPWLSASPEDPVVSFLHHTRWSLFAKVVSAYAWAGKHLQLFQKSLQ